MLRRNRFWCRFGFVGEYFIQFLIRSCRSGCFCSDSNFCHRFFLPLCGPLFCGCSGRGQYRGAHWWSFYVVSEYSLQLCMTFCTSGHCCSHSDLIFFSLFMCSFFSCVWRQSLSLVRCYIWGVCRYLVAWYSNVPDEQTVWFGMW